MKEKARSLKKMLILLLWLERVCVCVCVMRLQYMDSGGSLSVIPVRGYRISVLQGWGRSMDLFFFLVLRPCTSRAPVMESTTYYTPTKKNSSRMEQQDGPPRQFPPPLSSSERSTRTTSRKLASFIRMCARMHTVVVGTLTGTWEEVQGNWEKERTERDTSQPWVLHVVLFGRGRRDRALHCTLYVHTHTWA